MRPRLLNLDHSLKIFSRCSSEVGGGHWTYRTSELVRNTYVFYRKLLTNTKTRPVDHTALSSSSIRLKRDPFYGNFWCIGCWVGVIDSLRVGVDHGLGFVRCQNLVIYITTIKDVTRRVLRGAEVACWAHNPKVRGSKPRGAITFASCRTVMHSLY